MSKIVIRGYTVNLDTHGDTVDCWISYSDHGTHYSASLAAAEATGVLEGFRGGERPIPDATIARIADWAQQHGY